MTTSSRRNKRKTRLVRFQRAQDLRDDEEEDEELCRCICSDNNPTAKRPWIQCTACEVWQHNECMDVSVFDDELGDHYWCEECGEETHAELLAVVRMGGRPWEARVAQRLAMKMRFEGRIEKALARVEWLWELYEPQHSVFAGDHYVVPSKRAAPRPYIDAVQVGLRIVFEDLPMQSFRDLAHGCDLSRGRRNVMKTLRGATAKEDDQSDIRQLDILAELFE